MGTWGNLSASKEQLHFLRVPKGASRSGKAQWGRGAKTKRSQSQVHEGEEQGRVEHRVNPPHVRGEDQAVRVDQDDLVDLEETYPLEIQLVGGPGGWEIPPE